MDGLPILFFNKPNEINQKILKEYSIVDANYEKLKLSWWMDLINFRKEKSKNIKIDFYEDDLDHHNSIVLFYKIYHKLDKNKKYKTLIRKIHARSLGRKINDKVGL